jgi:fructose-1,6-bisphosphatase/inositol monophosphatase family enzyme
VTTASTTGGYWLVAADGGVFSFNAPFSGSLGATHLNAPIVGMAADPATGGYWLVGADGGVFSFNAPFSGSLGATHLNAPVVGTAAPGYGLGTSQGPYQHARDLRSTTVHGHSSDPSGRRE